MNRYSKYPQLEALPLTQQYTAMVNRVVLGLLAAIVATSYMYANQTSSRIVTNF